jgi:outer membrane protein TolC
VERAEVAAGRVVASLSPVSPSNIPPVPGVLRSFAIPEDGAADGVAGDASCGGSAASARARSLIRGAPRRYIERFHRTRAARRLRRAAVRSRTDFDEPIAVTFSRHTSRFAALAAALALGAGAAPLAAQAAADSLSLSVDDAVRRALETGDEVRLANARREAASAQIGVARASGLPQLRMAGNFSHVYENARAQAVGQIFNQPNTYNVNLNLSMPLFQGGRVGAGLRGAASLRAAAEADVLDTRADVTVQVLQAYLSALLADRLVQIQLTNLQQAEARLTQVQQFEAAGRASRYDVLRARVERANLEPTLIQARGDRDLAFLELRRLLNLPTDQPVRLTSGVRPDEARSLAAAMDAASAALDSASFAGLPAVRAAELRAVASRASVSIAKADYLPSVSIVLQNGWQAFPLETRLPLEAGRLDTVDCPAGSAADRVCTQQNGGWFTDRNLALQVSWPVFDGLRTRSNVALARSNYLVAQLQARQAREAAAVEAGRARSLLRSAATDVATVTPMTIEDGVALTGDLHPLETIDAPLADRGRSHGPRRPRRRPQVYVREGEQVAPGAQLLARVRGERAGQRRRAAARAPRPTAWPRSRAGQRAVDARAEPVAVQAGRRSPSVTCDLAAGRRRRARARRRRPARLRASSNEARDTRVVAPASGVVEKRLVDGGVHLSAARRCSRSCAGRAGAGRRGARAAGAAVRAGQVVHFVADARRFDGKVARVSPTIDPATRAVTVYVQVPNPGGTLRGGTFATGRVVSRTLENVARRPRPPRCARGRRAASRSSTASTARRSTSPPCSAGMPSTSRGGRADHRRAPAATRSSSATSGCWAGACR